jgi:tetratricopeptide (TPR) repeat protein
LLGGSADESEPELRREAMVLTRRGLEARDRDALKAAILLADLVDPDEADALARDAIAQMGAIAAGDEQLEESLESLAVRLGRDGVRPPAGSDDERLEDIYRRILARRRTMLPAGTPAVVEAERWVGAALERRALRLLRNGQNGEADPAFFELEQLYADIGDRERLAGVRRRRAACLSALGRFEEAERELDESRRLEESQPVLNGLADLYERWNRPAERDRYRSRVPPLSIADVTDLGPVRFDARLRERTGGHTAVVGGRVMWVFSDTRSYRAASDGKQVWHSTLGWTEAAATTIVGSVHEPLSADGLPIEILFLGDHDAAFNAAHTGPSCRDACGAEYYLQPGALVTDAARNRGLLFYTRMLHGPHIESEPAGASIAVIVPGHDRATRPVVQPVPGDTAMLFEANEPSWGSAAVVEDGTLYVYASTCTALGCRTLLAKVPAGGAFDRSAWRFYAGGRRWSEDWHAARSVIEGSVRTRLSVHFNVYLGKYLAISSPLISSRVAIRIADRPEGPWSLMSEVQTERSTPGWDWTFSALGHPELARDGGRIEYVTVGRNVSGRNELRMMEVRFRKK